MKFDGKIYGITKDIQTGKILLTIAIDGNIGEEINELYEKKITTEIKPYRKKRSRNANNYMWELCTLIGDKLDMSAVEVYRKAIKEVNVFRDFILTEDEAQTFKTSWELLGDGWLVEQVDYDEDGERVIMRAYYGSSRYNTKQMSRLIDCLSTEAEQLGITLLSDREKSLLLENWKNKKEVNKNG